MAPKTFSNESLSRCDQFYQIFVQIGANLAIFQPFEISIFFRNFERPFTPRNQLRSASNLAKTRFRRSPTFHFSTPKTNFRRNFRIEISCFRYFGQVFVCTQHTCVLCLYTTHMCVVCIHNTHVCCVYTRQMASSFPSYGHQKVSLVTAVGEFLKQIQNRNAHTCNSVASRSE